MAVELAVTTNFSFLRGASHPEEMVTQAKILGLEGICVCDRNSLGGVVRAHMAAKEAELAFYPGCRLVFIDDTPDILVWPQNREGYGQLCELLSLGKRRAPKGECHLTIDDLAPYQNQLLLALFPSSRFSNCGFSDQKSCNITHTIKRLKPLCEDRLYLTLTRTYGALDRDEMSFIAALAHQHKLPLIATTDALYHRPERRPLQDVLTCIRNHVSLSEAGTMLLPNGERHLRSPTAMTHLFKGYESAVTQSTKLFRRLNFSLDELRYQYPEQPSTTQKTPQEMLSELVKEGIQKRYPPALSPLGPPQKITKAISHELGLIERLDYAPYFLTVHDIVRFARSQKILCQGRGSAANSAVCYCLGITEVDPQKIDLLFERFISEERGEPPDIDVDFEHERREEVIQYIYKKYGREHAGLAATVITYRARSALREAGKVFGFTEDMVSAIAGTKWGSWSRKIDAEDAKQAGLDPSDPHLAQMLDLARQLIGFPRHLSQHVGGFVITRDRLSSLIPIENAAMQDRTIVEWDKDDLESLGMLKIDILALGMLTAIRKCFELLTTHYDRTLNLGEIKEGDKATYDMICRADTVGVFQIESRAQMSMLPRLKPRCYYDLVIEVAIVRPGPIQGDMVHPYLRRRQKKEPVIFPKPELAKVLGKTLGVPLFQEQAMNIAIIAAGFTPGEADKLRRAMATFRRVGTIHSFQLKMVEGMVKNGYDREFAEHCFRQIEGFGDYGFPESHAASFALLVYVSCWLKCHYPDVFLAAMLNSQPLGFYAPAQLVRDAREHGVEVLPVDVNFSNWHSTLEKNPKDMNIHPRHREMAGTMKNTHAVRLGFHQVKGFGKSDGEKLMENRGKGYDSIRDLWLRSGLPRKAIEKLAEADCFSSLGLSRRDALWAVKALDPFSAAEGLPLFATCGANLQAEKTVHLPPMLPGEEVIYDYRSLSLSLKAHPVSFTRSWLESRGFIKSQMLDEMASGRWVKIAGLVLVRQRPGTAKGVVFETIEDETGVANVIIWPKIFEKYRKIVLGSRFVAVYGKLQSQDGVIHVVANRLEDLTPALAEIGEGLSLSNMAHTAQMAQIGGLANADEVKRPIMEISEKMKPGSRLSRLLAEAPELKRDFVELSHHKTRNRFRRNSAQSTKQVTKALPKGRNFH